MGADYIITGALGHLAQNIIARLRPRGCRIVGIDRPEAVQGAETDFKLYGADVRDSQAIRGIFRAEAREYTVVIHTAALVHISDEESADVFAVNVGGGVGFRIAESLRFFERICKRRIFFYHLC